MIELLTICTGNVCRSPLAEVLIQAQMDSTVVTVRSAGTHALVGEQMTEQAIALVEGERGLPLSAVQQARRHAAVQLREPDVRRADLVLAMTRQHRTQAVELAPSRLRASFTLREFGRLAKGVDTAELSEELAGVTDPQLRLQRTLALVAARRGAAVPVSPADGDDVIDPFRRSSQTYASTLAQILPAVSEVVRLLRSVADPLV